MWDEALWLLQSAGDFGSKLPNDVRASITDLIQGVVIAFVMTALVTAIALKTSS
jgi:hypothetical protein